MSETERSHHEYQIEHQKVEKEKQQRDFEFKYADLIEKFENDKQNIGRKKINFMKLLFFFSFAFSYDF